MEAVDCKTAGQLFSGAISPPINHNNHGECPHVNACVRHNLNLNLPNSAQSSCKSWVNINIAFGTEPPSASSARSF